MPEHRFMRLYRVEGDADDAGAPITFVAATAGMKGDGIDLGADVPWDFSRGIEGATGPRYPFLWVHDLIGRNLPLGVADVLTDPGEMPMRVEVSFDPEDELAMRVRGKYLSPVGGLAGISVSWDDVGEDGIPVRATGKDVVARQLLEISAVPVGLDPDALKEGARAELVEHLRGLRDDLDAILTDDSPAPEPIDGADPDTGTDTGTGTGTGTTPDTDSNPGDASPADEDSWRTCAAAMVDVFDRGSDDSDEKRRRAYNALLPTYRRLAKEPPEWVGGDELRALDEDNWRALFLAGEIEAAGLRAGAELSARNIQDLTSAVADIQAGVDRIETLLERVASKDQPSEGGDRAEGEASSVLDELSGWLDLRLEGEEADDDPAS